MKWNDDNLKSTLKFPFVTIAFTFVKDTFLIFLNYSPGNCHTLETWSKLMACEWLLTLSIFRATLNHFLATPLSAYIEKSDIVYFMCKVYVYVV